MTLPVSAAARIGSGMVSWGVRRNTRGPIAAIAGLSATSWNAGAPAEEMPRSTVSTSWHAMQTVCASRRPSIGFPGSVSSAGARARRTPSKRGHPSEAIQARPSKREGTGAAKEFASRLGVSFSPPIVGKTHPGPACWSRPRPLPGPEPKSVFRVRSAPKARRAPRCFGSVQIIVIMPGTDRAGPSGRKESTGSIAPAVDGG